LGNENQIVENFYGITFSVNFDSDILFTEAFPFPPIIPSNDEPFFEDNEDFIMISIADPIENRLDVAFSKIGNEPSDIPFGQVGSLFIVIVDNVVGLGSDQIETLLEIEDVKLVDENGVTTPVIPTSTVLTIYNDDIINSTDESLAEQIKTYPNPVNDQLFIKSNDTSIRQVELIAATGQIVYSKQNIIQNNWTVATNDLANGLYSLNIYTDQGVLSQKVVIQH